MSNKCRCESSLCDHMKSFKARPGFPHGVVDQCKRPPDHRFEVSYVGQMCTQCVSNMCSSDGSQYITLKEEVV